MRWTILLSGLIGVATVSPGDLIAQQPVPPVTSIPSPSAKRASPLNYFMRSMLIPGWGQASLDRKLTGGMFLAFEGLALGMALKTHNELEYLERTGSDRVDDKRQERQDWFVLVGMNHLFSGLEAFVSANLFDFPGDLTVRPLPGGRTGYGLRLPVPQ